MSDKNELDIIRKSLEESVKNKSHENIIMGLAELNLLIDKPHYAYREKAFEIEETVMEDLMDIETENLKVVDNTVIDNIRNAIFLEVKEAKKKIKVHPETLEEIKKRFKKLITKKPPDLNKLALVLHEAILIEEPGDVIPKYIVNTLKELGLFDEVDILLDEIITRAGEKREREEVIIKKNHESRLRKLEREQAKELKKEYAEVSKRAGSFHKTLDAIYGEAPLATPEFESPGICEKCGYPIRETFYYQDMATGVLMHSDCAKKVLEIKKKEKGKALK